MPIEANRKMEFSILVQYGQQVVALKLAVDGCADLTLGVFFTFNYFLPE